MLRTGREYLEGLRDGRRIYIGAERVDDVVQHAGFRGAVETVAELYDLKLDPLWRGDMVVEEGPGAPYSAYFREPLTRQHLEQRMRCHERIADATCGVFGRSPDHVASLVTGLAMEADVLGTEDGRDFASNLLDYYQSLRDRDAYVAYAVLPHRGLGSETVEGDATASSGLRVVREEDDGVVLQGVKGIATAAMLADEIWIGNLQPLPAGGESEAITCVVACNAPGLQIWSRRAFAAYCTSECDSPLTWRFDEGDAMLVFDNVKVHWNRVFVHCDPVRSSQIYLTTPAHCLANHQSAVRSLAKVRLMVGLANRVASTIGAQGVPAVRSLLGRLAALESTLAALVDAQVDRLESWPKGGVSPNRRYVYAALNWCQEHMPALVEALRELSASGAFRFPAHASALRSPDVAGSFRRFWGTPAASAIEQMQLFRLVWDLTGSEFAGRQVQYEGFYAGPSFVVRGHNHREAPWSAFDDRVQQLLARPR